MYSTVVRLMGVTMMSVNGVSMVGILITRGGDAGVANNP